MIKDFKINNNGSESKNSINSENKKKVEDKTNKKRIKKIILISVIIIALLVLVSEIIIVFKAAEKNKQKIENKNKQNIENQINILLSDIDYEDSITSLNLKVVENNHILLDGILNNINNSLIRGQNYNLYEISTKINYNNPNFLENPTKGALKIVKSDLEFYERKYEELSKEVNNLTMIYFEFLENLSFPLNNLENELNNILYQFEDLIKNISIPLISQKKLNEIRILNEQNNEIIDEKLSLFYQLEEYINETEKLNNLYNKMFNYFDESIQIINNEIIEFPESIIDFQNEVEEGISKLEEITLDFKDPDDIEKIHENLKKIKQNLSFIKVELIKKRDKIENRIKEIENKNEYIIERNKMKIEKIKEESNEILENLKIKSNIIKNEIIEQAKKKYITSVNIPELNASNIISDILEKSIDNAVKYIIIEEKIVYNKFEEIQSFINIEEKTSLDILIILDITISMKPYLSQVKQNLINIINKIVLECPGIDLNFGFIGYRDDDHALNYTDIDFTQNYEKIKNSLIEIKETGGTDDPEDLQGGMEMALKKNWKSNARFSILVADDPCHGNKYHISNMKDNYPNGIPYRKNLEESIEELAKKNISLLCMKITNHTDIMYEIFQNIYNNYNNCKFDIIPIESENNLSDIIVDSSVDIYVNKRNIQ